MYAHAFIIVIEAGILEENTLLLVESIREFGGPCRHSAIYVVQPREGVMISQKTMNVLTKHDVIYIRANFNDTWFSYGVANKVYAAAFIESLVKGTVDSLTFLDSDTIIVNPPVDLFLETTGVVAVRPTDIRGVGQLVSAPLTPYWESVWDVCGVNPPVGWDVSTTVDEQRIYPYFNSGLVTVNPQEGLFQLWRENMDRLARDERISSLPQRCDERIYLDQAALAATILSKVSQQQTTILDHRYNYPLHLHGRMPQATRVSSLDELVVVHYHRIFQDRSWINNISVDGFLAKWLLARLPLSSGKTSRWRGVPERYRKFMNV